MLSENFFLEKKLMQIYQVIVNPGWTHHSFPNKTDI